MHNTSLTIVWIGLCLSTASAQGDVEKLPVTINTTQYDETSPVLSHNNDKLFFTRTADPGFEPTLTGEFSESGINKADEIYQARLAAIYSQISGREITEPYASIYNQDIWYTELQDDRFMEPVHPGYPLNNALPNSLISNGMATNEFVLLNQFYQDGSMYAGFSRVQVDEKGYYSFPEPMHIYNFQTTASDVNLTMTPDGQLLVISLHRADSKGSNDLYVSFFVRDNVWSSPIHMGNTLNTVFQETTPHISPDKRFLYFSSDRPGGKGGNDIYRSERMDYSWTKWSEPELVSGVNTSQDESQPYFDTQGEYMYFSSRRDGSSDIFRQRLTPRPQLEKPLLVRGKIVNTATGKPVHSELFWGEQSAEGFLEYFNTYTGEFEVSLTQYDSYKFQPRKANHFSPQMIVDPREFEKKGVDTLDVVLYVEPKPYADVNVTSPKKKSIETSEAYPKTMLTKDTRAFYNIYFEKSKPTILIKSKSALEYILGWMLDYPDMEILIEGHTDNVGDESDLIDLSLQRAEAVRSYLVHHGIQRSRLQVSGLGATRPLFSNLTESGREKNRRVEITVIKRPE